MGSLPTVPAIAQDSGTIAGQVTEAKSGEPLPGVNIVVVETDLGTATGADGSFRIESVPAGDQTVEASFLGYRSVRRQVQVQAGEVVEIDLEMEASAMNLEEVVVTGTAAGARRRELGNSIAAVDAAEIAERSQPTGVADLIRGRATGVSLNSGTGAAAAGPRIKIRGTGSLALGDQPIIYVDGVRVNNAEGVGPNSQGYGSGIISRLGDFSVDEIARIEIVRGPSAATLYGTEASGGVIQIFTKRGRQNQEAQWTFKTSQGATWLNDAEHRFPPVWGNDPETGGIQSWNIIGREIRRGNPVFRTGHDQSYNMSVRGGGSEVTYFLSGSHEWREGVYPTDRVRRENLRANLGFTPGEAWDVQVSTGYVNGTFLLPDDIGSGPIFNGMFTFPSNVNTPTRGFLSAPPDVLYRSLQSKQLLDRFNGSVDVRHNPTDWFDHRLTVGGDLTQADNIVQQPYLGPEGVQFFGPAGARGGRSFERRSEVYLTVDYAATVNQPLSDHLNSETSAGIQYYVRQSSAATVEGEEYAAPDLETVSSTARQFADESFVKNVTLGTYLQERIGWRDQLFVTAAGRIDNNSAFGQDFDYVFYPKVSGSWTLSDASFWNVDFVNSFRLRAAYGAAGQQPESFSALRYYLPVTTGRGEPGIKPESPGNPELSPERSTELEAGLDASLFDGRLGVNFTYYDQHTTDALLQRQLAPSGGFPGRRWVNIGEVQSRGLDLSLTVTPVRRDNLSWTADFQLAHNFNNEVLDVGAAATGTTADGNDYITLDTMLDTPSIVLRHQEGKPPGSWFGLQVVSAEFDEDGNPVNVLCDGGAAVDHEPVSCDQAPYVFLGQSTRKFQGSFSTSLTLFDRLTVSGLIEFKYGQKHGNNDEIVRCQLFRVCRANFFPSEYEPALIAQYQSTNLSSFGVADAGFAKLRNLTVSYLFPERWVGYLGAESARLSVSAHDLYTWTDWPGLDPETYFTSPSSTSSNFDKSSQTFTPIPRRVTGALKVTF